MTDNEMRGEVVDKVAALATAAFGLVAALAWNTAIQKIFETYFGAGSAIVGLVIYAVAVTALAVGATIWIGRASSRVHKRIDRAGPRSPGRPLA